MKQFLRKMARRLVGVGSLPMPNNRWQVLGEAVEYVSTMTRFESEMEEDSLRGDYFEFGVWQGRTFAYAVKNGIKQNDYMRFFACDSFQGLPEPKDIDSGGEFEKGQFCCSKKEFLQNIKSFGISESRVETVEGWFNSSLNDELIEAHNIKVAALSYIDCDLYESCVPVLEFLTPLVRQGSILMFDDWYMFRASASKGVQKATVEWLAKNPRISLIDWKCFGPYGKAFIVNIADGENR